MYVCLFALFTWPCMHAYICSSTYTQVCTISLTGHHNCRLRGFHSLCFTDKGRTIVRTTQRSIFKGCSISSLCRLYILSCLSRIFAIHKQTTLLPRLPRSQGAIYTNILAFFLDGILWRYWRFKFCSSPKFTNSPKVDQQQKRKSQIHGWWANSSHQWLGLTWAMWISL